MLRYLTLCLPFAYDMHVNAVGIRFLLGGINLESIGRLGAYTECSSGSVKVGLR